MSKIILKAEKREVSNKSAVKKIRREGRLPGIIYGANKQPEAISVCMREFKKIYSHSNFFSSIFELDGVDEKGTKYIVKDMQYHPVTDAPIHIDFMRISKGSKVAVKIALNFINQEKSPGLKQGGVLNILAHEIEVMCDPDFIPESIDVDMTGMEFHHSIHVFDVKLPKDIALPVSAKNYTVATVVAPTIVKEQEAPVEQLATEEAN